jgi:hypothetical protein
MRRVPHGDDTGAARREVHPRAHSNPQTKERDMPEKKTIARARKDLKQGKSASTAAGEFVHEEIEHIRQGKHGARSTKQAIAIGLSKARRAGVPLRAPKNGQTSESTRRSAERDSEVGQGRRRPRRPSAKRSQATRRALKREPRSAASSTALSRQPSPPRPAVASSRPPALRRAPARGALAPPRRQRVAAARRSRRSAVRRPARAAPRPGARVRKAPRREASGRAVTETPLMRCGGAGVTRIRSENPP